MTLNNFLCDYQPFCDFMMLTQHTARDKESAYMSRFIDELRNINNKIIEQLEAEMMLRLINCILLVA